MLTQSLRDLQRDGLIARRVYPTAPPSVDYRLTDLGRSLLEPLGALIRWAEAQVEAIAAARQDFDAAAQRFASAVLERRRPLLGEGAHAFLLVLGGEQRVEQPPLEPQAFGERGLERAVDALLGGEAPPARNRRRSSPATFSASSTNSAAGTTRATRPERSASAASIMRPVSANSIAFALPMARVSRCVPPAPGMTPSLISGWPNLAVSAARMKSHIIASSQPPPSAKPATAAISGLRARADIVPAADEVAEEHLGEALVLHFLDVGAGGERLVGAGQHHGADPGLRLEGAERQVELLDQRAVERVQRLRPIEADEPDAAVGLDENVGVGCHERTPVAGDPTHP